ncbi:MAG TPA: hypothetical protein VKA84_12300 [Gemmatimonadaceae bacterium]|nr:hypothetical protein [Gemmatimonadaceae bacterium]
MTRGEFSRAFSKSPMKRVLRLRSGQASLRGLKRNAAVGSVQGEFRSALSSSGG